MSLFIPPNNTFGILTTEPVLGLSIRLNHELQIHESDVQSWLPNTFKDIALIKFRETFQFQ